MRRLAGRPLAALALLLTVGGCSLLHLARLPRKGRNS